MNVNGRYKKLIEPRGNPESDLFEKNDIIANFCKLFLEFQTEYDKTSKLTRETSQRLVENGNKRLQ